MPERRNYDRFSIAGDINIRVGDKSSNEVIKSYLDNLSFGGLSIYAQKRIDVNQVVDFELKTSLLGEFLTGKGKIKYVNEPKKFTIPIFVMGLEFIDVDKDKVGLLLKRIQARVSSEIQEKSKIKPIDFIPY